MDTAIGIQRVATVVVAKEVLLKVAGSVLLLFTEAALLITVLLTRLSAAFATRVNVALLPLARDGMDAETPPTLPAGGVLVTHPAGAASDTKVKLEGRPSVKTTFCALLGPLFLTVMV
jgi:hypothetical protein